MPTEYKNELAENIQEAEKEKIMQAIEFIKSKTHDLNEKKIQRHAFKI